MSIIETVLLGILQGITEFLPISSSGHLIIFRTFFGMDASMLSFDICLHIGTLFAVIVVFWKDIIALLRKPFCRATAILVVATVPVVILGLFFDDALSNIFSAVLPIAIALTVTGILMYTSDRFSGNGELKDLPFGKALLVGIFQGVAILPGISRSGSTIFGSLLCGLNREEAARFSFLLSIIAILGAAAKESYDTISESGSFFIEPVYFAGMFAAAVTGFVAIRFFLALIKKAKLKYFAYYCWGFAAVSLIWNYVVL